MPSTIAHLYRTLTAEESAIRTCSTAGCPEPPRYVHTIRWLGGIGFYAECEDCKARIARGWR